MKIILIIISLFVSFHLFGQNKKATIKKEKQAIQLKGLDQRILSFDEFIKDFFVDFNIEKIDNYISEDYGLFYLHNPGAFIVISHLQTKDKFDLSFYRETYKTKYMVKEGPIPEFSCDQEGWNIQGCYWKKGKYPIVYNAYQWMIEYDLIEINEPYPDVQKAKELSNIETYCVYATDIVCGFYFIKINKTYHLYMMDLIDPCSA